RARRFSHHQPPPHPLPESSCPPLTRRRSERPGTKKKKNDLLFPISSGRACGVSAVRRANMYVWGCTVCKVVTICAYSTWYYHSIDSGERVRHVCLDSACRYSVHLHADVCKAACGPGQWAPPLRLSLCVSLTMLLRFFFLVF